MFRKTLLCVALPVCLSGLACMTPVYWETPAQQIGVGTPVFVPGNNEEAIWERTVDVLHDYRFQIARENKLDGLIETEYKVGAGLMEPWHRDSVDYESRLESTLQSIRRRATVRITRAEGGFLIHVEVQKELEDLVGLAANSAGGATFQENTPLQRDLNLVLGQSAPSGWIPQGRDLPLEQDMLRRLHRAFAQ